MLFKDAEGIRMRDLSVAVAVAVAASVDVDVSRTHLCVTGSHFNGCLIASYGGRSGVECEGAGGERECVTRRDTFMDIATFCPLLQQNFFVSPFPFPCPTSLPAL